MSIQHTEAILDAAVASLRAGLNPALAAINAGTTDFDLELADDDAIDVSGFEMVKSPSVEVAVADWRMTNFSLAQLVADMACPILVRAVVFDANNRTVYRRSMRMSQAIISVLVAPDAFGRGYMLSPENSIRGAYRFNPETDQRQELQGNSFVAFSIEGVEVR